MSDKTKRFLAAVLAFLTICASIVQVLHMFNIDVADMIGPHQHQVNPDQPAPASDTAAVPATNAIGQPGVAANYCAVSPMPGSTAAAWYCAVDDVNVGASCGCATPAGLGGGMLLRNRLGTAVRLSQADLATHCRPKPTGAGQSTLHDLGAPQLKGTACQWDAEPLDTGLAE